MSATMKVAKSWAISESALRSVRLRGGGILAAFDHRLGPEFKSLGRVQHRLVERVPRRDAARQIRKPDADSLAFFLFDDGDIMGHASIQSFRQFASL
jgi:hypothetical protein